VLFLSSSYPIFKKGHWQNWSPRHETAKRLVKQGVTVFVVAPHTEGAAFEETIDGVKIFRFGKNAQLDFRKISPIRAAGYLYQYYSKAKEVCEKNRVDIVHGFWAIPGGTVAKRLSRKYKIPFVVELLGSDVFLGLQNIATKHFVKSAIENADYIFADGYSLIDFAKEKKVKMKKVFVHFYEPEIHKPSSKKILQMKKKWKIGKNDLVIMVSRFKGKIYGAEYAIRAMPKIIKKSPNAKLLLVGKAGDYENVIEEEIKKSGAGKNIVKTGFLDKPEYWCALKTSSIYLSPSLSDSTSVALLEAVAAKKPIIATNIGDNAHWVKNNVNGKIIPAADTKAIINAVLELKDSDLKKIGMANKKILEKEPCTWKGIIEKYIEIYETCLKEK
jgi:glycosyltransferase involved in cell wall biosynthesis